MPNGDLSIDVDSDWFLWGVFVRVLIKINSPPPRPLQAKTSPEAGVYQS